MPSDISSTAAILSLAMPRSQKSNSTRDAGSQKDTAGAQERRVELARLLVEMCLNGGIAGARVGSDEQIVRILTRQSIYLEALSASSFLFAIRKPVSPSFNINFFALLQVLPLLPPSLPITLLTPFLTRSLSRSLHSHHEASLFKGLALSQNLEISERLGELQLKLGGTLQSTGDLPGTRRMGMEEDDEIVILVGKESKEKGQKNDVVDLGLSLN